METNEIENIILVASGKGGVGKTTVATDLAKRAAEVGMTPALIDADVSTPNSPEAIGGESWDAEDQRMSTGDFLTPPVVDGVQVISQGLVIPDDVPNLRGAQWRAETVVDYIQSVQWDEGTDLLVVDSPPGSGEELQTVASAVDLDHAVVVTTPHPSSVRDSTKTREFMKQADVDHSVLVNMAYIPAGDIVDYVAGATDFREIQGIGESKEESVIEVMREGVSDFALFGYDPGEGVDIGVDPIATVPYTLNLEKRTEYVELVLEEVVGGQEVEA